MEKIYNVDGMKCGACKESIETSLSKMSGIKEVLVDLEAKTVKVVGDNFNEDEVKENILDLGFDVE